MKTWVGILSELLEQGLIGIEANAVYMWEEPIAETVQTAVGFGIM